LGLKRLGDGTVPEACVWAAFGHRIDNAKVCAVGLVVVEVVERRAVADVVGAVVGYITPAEHIGRLRVAQSARPPGEVAGMIAVVVPPSGRQDARDRATAGDRRR